jgi:uncharacterized protein (DUF362 family)/Pyruvate/2-oxoacid:ferredoxin oxidoreductase delta subunit
MKSKVYIRECWEYDYAPVKNAVSEIFEDAGGVATLFKRNSKILLKPNVITSIKPEKCATTHPLVLKAVIECLKNVTDSIYVGDSPAVGSSRTVLEKSEIMGVIEETGAFLADFDTPVSVSHPAGVEMKYFEIAAECADYDHFISLPKCKTHCHLQFTGALKNQYGVIPGLRKARGHMQFNTKEKFADMLVDINTYLKPDFAVMDAVYGIEGDGLKESGPRKIGLILGSADLVALDSIACRIISLDPARTPVVKEAYARKYGAMLLDEIEQVGVNYEDFVVRDFKNAETDRSIEHLRSFPLPLRKMIYDSIIRKPYFDSTKCSKCGDCLKICPSEPVALRMDENGISVDYDKCSKCYCCYEACEHGAVFLKSGILGKILKL